VPEGKKQSKANLEKILKAKLENKLYKQTWKKILKAKLETKN